MLSIPEKIDLMPLSVAHTDSDPLGLTPPEADTRKRFLRFSLSQQHPALLPLEHVIEVMQLSKENILPIPDMPGCVLGVCSWQGETLWLVDFNHLVGHESLYRQTSILKAHSVIVVQHNDRTIGLVVEQVIDIDLLDESAVQMGSGFCSPELESFVIGHCPQKNSVLLSISAIVNHPNLHTSGKYP